MSPDVASNTAPVPILLIHGFLCLKSFMLPVRWMLRRRGLRTEPVDLSPLCVQDIHELAAELERNVDRVLARSGAERCDLVGISQGGFIALSYAQLASARGRVRRLVALGTPFMGAPVSALVSPLLGGVLPGLRQIVPGSPYLRELHEAGIPEGVEVTSIAVSGDPISPPERCRLDGARFVRVPGIPSPVTHQAVIFAPGALRALEETLTRPG